MSAEAIIGIIALVIGSVGTIAGAAWWMSAMYARVGHIQESTASTADKLDTLTESMDGGFKDVRQVQFAHSQAISDLRERVTRTEDR